MALSSQSMVTVANTIHAPRLDFESGIRARNTASTAHAISNAASINAEYGRASRENCTASPLTLSSAAEKHAARSENHRRPKKYTSTTDATTNSAGKKRIDQREIPKARSASASH